MKLLFIRHGETDFNKREHGTPNIQDIIATGQRIDNPLNETGKEQAKKAAAQLPENVDLIFSSPLKRASQTAEIINKRFNLLIEYRDDLKERDYGSLSGKTWGEMAKESGIPSLYEVDKLLEYDYRPYGGESVDEVKSRLLNFIKELKEKYDDKTIVIITHGGLIRVMHAIYPQKERPLIGNATIHEFDL